MTRGRRAGRLGRPGSGRGAPIFYDSPPTSPPTMTPARRYRPVRLPAGPRRRRPTPLGALPVALHRDPDPLGQLRRIRPGIVRRRPCSATSGTATTPRSVGADRPGRRGGRAARHHRHRLAAEWGAGWYGLVNVDAVQSHRGRAVRGRLGPGAHLVDRLATDLTGLPVLPASWPGSAAGARANLNRTAAPRRRARHGHHSRPAGRRRSRRDRRAVPATATRFGTAGFYPAGTFARFVTALGPLAHVIQVRQHGRLVAAGVCLTDATRFHTWTCGVDYGVTGNASPYPVLYAHSVALALRLRRPVFEGGRGNETFKRRHGLLPRPLDAYLRRTP